MVLNARQLRSRAAEFMRHSRTRKTAIWLVSIFVAFGVLLGLIAPPILRVKIAGALSEKLHRNVSIEQIRINPYAMTATVRGFLMNERQSKTTALSFDELYVNLQLQSLIRLAPVIKELRLSKPYINLSRNEDLKYNFQDLIDEFTSGPPGGPTPRFALNNIQVIDGKIDFDDQPEQTEHSISSIRLGVPFISSLPSYTDIFVRPSFSANINGAPVELGGQAKPFNPTHDSAIELEIDQVKINKYLEYSPVKLNFNVPSGELNGKINAAFRAAKDKPSVFTIGGTLGLRKLAVEQNGAPLLKIESLDVLIDAINVFANKTTLKSIKADGVELHLTRARDGSVNLAHLVSVPETTIPQEQKKESKPYAYEIHDVLIDSGMLYFDDDSLERPFKTRLNNLHIGVKGLTNEPEKQTDVELSFESDAKERFSHEGKLTLTPFAAEGKLHIEGLKPAGFGAYYQSAVALDVKQGSLDLSAEYSLQTKDDRSELKFTNMDANLQNLRLELPGQSEPLWRIPSLVIKGGSVDVSGKTVLIGAVEAKGGNGYVRREKGGALNYTRIVKAQSSNAAPEEPAKTEQTEWKIEAKQIALDNFQINVDDRSAATPTKFIFSDVFGRIDNFSNAKNQPGKVRLRTRINKTGLLRLNGTAGTNPITAKLAVEGRDIDLLPLQPYLGDQVNFSLTGGRVSTKGTLSYDSGGSAPARANYQGGVDLNDVGTIEKSNNQDLFKWKVLGLDQLQFTSEPLQVRIGQINLADFYSRVIIGPDGKINLQNLTTKNEETPTEQTPQDAAQPAATAATPGAETKPNEQRVTIGKINLQGGNINFSDFLVKPNYSANLTDVQGTISELKPETPGDIDIKARLDQDAPVDINGKINPLGKDLFLDIVADARDIEMNPFSPYSAKYVGYGIERGKLSFNVKYKLENRQLTAQNKIILNQLTFGDKIESPQATKLPVLLAVALLKDRNGVIDVELPISGSLDDPQFSVGGIILRLVINLITKAVTAPFALLGSVFGGSSNGEELSYIEFDSGRATLSEAAHNKIATLGKAMNNRPALKLELTGRTDPVSDPEGLKRVAIERKVKAQKLKDLSRKGDAPKSVDEVQVNGSEYPQYLKAAYGEESFPKPRNAIGLARNLPVSEMEKLMIQHTTISDDDVRQLANRRAEVARDAILATGQVGSERVSIAPAKPLSSEESAKIKAKLNRVDFSLR